MGAVDSIIKKADSKVQGMLESVYEYNSSFPLSKKQKKLLERVLFAISFIDRKYFIEKNPYLDTALSIGKGQTISQPSTVARMLLLAELSESDDVLEVGSGSGWNASLIAYLVYPGSVVSIERINSLKEKAKNNFSKLKNYLKKEKPEVYEKLSKVNFLTENIFEKGSVWKKKYDKILLTAGIVPEQEAWISDLADKLLKDKGVLICPYNLGPLLIFRKNGKIKKSLTREEYAFVPLLE